MRFALTFGTANRKKAGSVTAHRRPERPSASKTPSPPKAAVKQLTEKERKKPKETEASGSSTTPMEAKPDKKASSGYLPYSTRAASRSAAVTPRSSSRYDLKYCVSSCPVSAGTRPAKTCPKQTPQKKQSARNSRRGRNGA